MKQMIAASIGNDVHIAGPLNFLELAKQYGYETHFLGPAVPLSRLIDVVLSQKPDSVGISYRLTPQTLEPLLEELKALIEQYDLQHITWLFGGTPQNCETAKRFGIFENVFAKSGDEESVAYLQNGDMYDGQTTYASDLTGRIRESYPYPLIRHHFGLPSLDMTISGVKDIASSGMVDIISIAPDQNAQEHFFEPDKMNEDMDGAGGVPIRKPDDLKRIYDAAQTGNHPLLRCYSGTNDIFDMAQMLKDTIDNAWAAIPLCWYNRLDGRGPRRPLESIAENQLLMKWHADRGIPVEVNEAHHWSLRGAHDAIGVAAAYLAAYNAKSMGVRYYISQMMFNVPPQISPIMDLAKMLAVTEMIDTLQDKHFTVFRQVRAGLASMPDDLDKAKGQLAASTYLAMALKPHIVHVVGFCEADHAAKPEEVVESCAIARAVIDNVLKGMPNMALDPAVLKRKDQLISDAYAIIGAIKRLDEHKDALIEPSCIAAAVKLGILDAPQLAGNPYAAGVLRTAVIGGACYAVDGNGKPIDEKRRLRDVLSGIDGSIAAHEKFVF
ncbi:MAG: hypothetical protein PWP55_1192 [Clostridiales bacterium]|nr:hypothetical protein [Clostridiales bacterium]